MTMAALVTSARVIPSLRAQDKRQVVRDLARVAASAASLDPSAVLQAVAARADLTSFGLGRGVAIPHAMVVGLDKPLGVFARLDPAVDFGAVDGRPADLVFLLLSPAGDEGTLLRALSCAARRGACATATRERGLDRRSVPRRSTSSSRPTPGGKPIRVRPPCRNPRMPSKPDDLTFSPKYLTLAA
jgi:PTS system nitrogen regulatory IIA component